MRKKVIIMTLIVFSFLLLLSGTVVFAGGVRRYINDIGHTSNNFHRDHFKISYNDSDVWGEWDTNSGGFYDGTLRPADSDRNYKLRYKLTFTAEDRQRIDKGDVDIRVKVQVHNADPHGWRSNADDVQFRILYNGATGELYRRRENDWDKGATWTIEKRIPVGASDIELEFRSYRNQGNDVKFSNIRVDFIDCTEPGIEEIWSSDTGGATW